MTSLEARPLSRRGMLRGTVMVAGAAVVLPSFAALGGCSSAPASLDAQMPLVTAIAGRIIPQTDTPGAVEAGVPDYIAGVFDKHFTGDQQAEFLSGLKEIARLAQNEGAADFAKAPPAKQDAVLRKLSNSAGGAQGKSAWQQLHDMTVFGYYTSEAATQELAYEEIPGRQTGCLPFEEIGRAWLDRGV